MDAEEYLRGAWTCSASPDGQGGTGRGSRQILFIPPPVKPPEKQIVSSGHGRPKPTQPDSCGLWDSLQHGWASGAGGALSLLGSKVRFRITCHGLSGQRSNRAGQSGSVSMAAVDVPMSTGGVLWCVSGQAANR